MTTGPTGRRRAAWIPALVAFFAFAAGVGAHDAPAGVRWLLESLGGGAAVPPEPAITLAVDEDRLEGYAGCNAYRGTVATPDLTDLEIGRLMATLSACEPLVQAREDEYLAKLGASDLFYFEAGRLPLRYSVGDRVDALLFRNDGALPAPVEVGEVPVASFQELALEPFVARLGSAPGPTVAELRADALIAADPPLSESLRVLLSGDPEAEAPAHDPRPEARRTARRVRGFPVDRAAQPPTGERLAYLTSSRLAPTSSNTTVTSALAPVPDTPTTVPLPNFGWVTFSPPR